MQQFHVQMVLTHILLGLDHPRASLHGPYVRQR